MSATATRHKLIKKIKDEKFDEEKLQRYVLLTQIGAKDFQAAIVDSDDDRLMFFEDYVFNEVHSPEDLQEALHHLYDAHEYLNAGFWKEVRVSIKNNKFIQMPSALFLEDAAQEYLRFNASVDQEKEVVCWSRNRLSEAITVFAVPQTLKQWLSGVYANTTLHFVHQSSALIEGVLHSGLATGTPPLFVYVDRFKLHVLFFRDSELVYYNQFLIKQFSDYVKYIMLVMKAMGMNQETGKVVLWGYIGKNSPHYQEFVRYVRNVSFGPRPQHLRFGYLFDDIQEHHFFDLYSIKLLPV